MSELVGLDGQPLQREVTTKRRRMKSQMKKSTSRGDILFQLTVDLPKEIGEDEYTRYMVEYFGIGYEAFKAKVR